MEASPLVPHKRVEWDDRMQNFDRKVRDLAVKTPPVKTPKEPQVAGGVKNNTRRKLVALS